MPSWTSWTMSGSDNGESFQWSGGYDYTLAQLIEWPRTEKRFKEVL